MMKSNKCKECEFEQFSWLPCCDCDESGSEFKPKDEKVSKKLISAFVQGAISDDNEREKVLKYIEEISE